MTTTENLYLPVGRQTYQDWTGMNDQVYFMSLKLAAGTSYHSDDEDYSEGGTYVRFGRIPAGMDRKAREKLVKAVSHSLSRHGCHHEYDCCGCASYSTSATLDRREIRVATTVSYNY